MTADPRNLTTVQHGTPLRDAAVDPLPTDYLPPLNAGKEGEEGNPHGPNVIAPEIHASQGTRPVRPGVVSDDPATQSTEELAHLAKWHPTAEATEPGEDPGT